MQATQTDMFTAKGKGITMDRVKAFFRPSKREASATAQQQNVEMKDLEQEKSASEGNQNADGAPKLRESGSAQSQGSHAAKQSPPPSPQVSSSPMFTNSTAATTSSSSTPTPSSPGDDGSVSESDDETESAEEPGTAKPRTIAELLDHISAQVDGQKTSDVLIALNYMFGGRTPQRGSHKLFCSTVEWAKGQLPNQSADDQKTHRAFNEAVRDRLVDMLPEKLQREYKEQFDKACGAKNPDGAPLSWDEVKSQMNRWIVAAHRTSLTRRGEPEAKPKAVPVQAKTVYATPGMSTSSMPAQGGASATPILMVPAKVSAHTLRLKFTGRDAPHALEDLTGGAPAIGRVSFYMLQALPDVGDGPASEEVFSREQLTMWTRYKEQCWKGFAALKTYAAMSDDTSRLIAARRELTDRDGRKLSSNNKDLNSDTLGCPKNGYDDVSGANLPGKQVSIAVRAPLLLPETGEVVQPVHLELSSISLSRREINRDARHYYRRSGPSTVAFNKEAYRTSMQTRLGHIEKCASDHPGHEVVLFIDGFVEELQLMNDEDRAEAMNVAAGEIANTVAALKQKGVKLYSAPAEVGAMSASSSAMTDPADRLTPRRLADDLWGQVHGKLAGSRVESIGTPIPNKSIGDNTILVTSSSPRQLAGSRSSEQSPQATQVLNRHRLLNVMHAMYCAFTNSGATPKQLRAWSES